MAGHGASLVGKGPVGARSASCRARVVGRSPNGAWHANGGISAARNRVGLACRTCNARAGVVCTYAWVVGTSRARLERQSQARRPCRGTVATLRAISAHGRVEILAQLARRTRKASRAPRVRVVSPRRARDATLCQQAGDADGKVCPGRARDRSNTRIRAVHAAAVALTTASGVDLEARVTKVAGRARVRAAGEVHWGQIQRRWPDPPAELAVDGGVKIQLHHNTRLARRLRRSKRHVSQREFARTKNFTGVLPAKAQAQESDNTQWAFNRALDECSKENKKASTHRSSIGIHVGVRQRCRARDVESPARLPVMSTRSVTAGRWIKCLGGFRRRVHMSTCV